MEPLCLIDRLIVLAKDFIMAGAVAVVAAAEDDISKRKGGKIAYPVWNKMMRHNSSKAFAVMLA